MEHKKVHITEVGPRDGFQNLADFIPTDEKVTIIDMLVDCGISRIEVSSFVHPKWIPQLADAAEVFGRIRQKPENTYAALIPNEKGLIRAIDSGVKEVEFVVHCTDRSNIENLNMTANESLAIMATVVQKAKEHGVDVIPVAANSFGCPYEGGVPAEKVLKLLRAFADLGVNRAVIADSTGIANPEQIKTLVTRLTGEIPDVTLSIHLHDILGIGLANAYAAYEGGVSGFESSISGLGGCPYSAHPGGNIATEELVYMFDRMGVKTGIDLNKLLATAQYVTQIIGHDPRKQEGHPAS